MSHSVRSTGRPSFARSRCMCHAFARRTLPADELRQSGTQILDELEDAPFRVGREGPLDVELSQLLADVAVHGVEDPLPAGPLLLHALEHPAVEAERLTVERGRERRGHRTYDVPAQVRPDLLERHATQRAGHLR